MNRIAWFAAVVLAVSPVVLAEDAGPEEIKKLIDQLGNDDYSKREQAADKLMAIGKPALPLLKEATGRDDLEIASRARLLLTKIGSSRLPGGEVDPAGPFVADRVTVSFVNGVRVLNIGQGQRSIRLQYGPAGIVMTVTGALDGQRVTREYVAHDPDELQRENPDAFALFDRCLAVVREVPDARVEIHPAMQQGLLMGPASAPDELDLLRVRLEGQMNRAGVANAKRNQVAEELDKLAAARGGQDLGAYAARSDELRKRLDELKLDPGDLLPPPARTRLGVSVTAAGDGRMVIGTVVENSRASRLGLRAGDVIESVDGKEVRNVAALRHVVVEKEKGLVVQILRDGAELKLREK